MSSGTSPKTRDFLANFGMSNDHTNQQEIDTQLHTPSRDDYIYGVSYGGPSSYHDKQYSPDMPPLRIRSRSPRGRFMLRPTTIPSPDGLGCGLEHLQFIRLISLSNHRRVFELRRYTFPKDKSIKLLLETNKYVSMPEREQIVLSTSEGDVFAILETFNALAGIYHGTVSKRRAKINIATGEVTQLTPVETREIPVGTHRTILGNYRVDRVDC